MGRRASAERIAARNQQPARGDSIPAPVRGWNAVDPIAGMKRGDAYQLDNWIPRAGYIEIRNGYADQVTGFSSAVESLLPYRAGDAEELFAASGSGIYDVTSTGSLGSAVVSGLANARWQSVNIANDAGIFMVLVNGADTPRKYDGSTWSTTSITGTSGSITLTPSNLEDVMMHKRRLFFREKGTLRVWYLGTDAISGSAGLLDLGPVFAEGGKLVGMGVWSGAGGTDTPLAVAVFLTDQGEVAVYRGNDPSDASNWALDGVYKVGKPLGTRAIFNTASDLVIITYDGAVPLSVAKSADRPTQQTKAVTARIQNEFAKAATAYGSKFGWEACLYPTGQLAIINVPVTELGRAYQFVQNTQTGAWCRFTGLNATCWAYVNGQIFFGGQDADGTKGVFRWDTGGSDNGTAIQCECITAFDAFGSHGRLKQFTMMRPILRAASSVLPYVDMLVDYAITQPSNVPDSEADASGGLWGDGEWGTALWTSSRPLRLDWTSANGIGHVGAIRVRVLANPDPVSGSYPTIRCELIGTDVQMIMGASM